MKKASFHSLRVRSKPGERTRGWLLAGPLAVPVALGRGGIRTNKREGDGGTPRGTFRLRRLWWRADRLTRPMTHLPVRRIRGDDGWCEDPRDRHYNRPVRLSPDHPGDRLKRSGMIWSRAGSSATLALRICWLNKEWDQLWQQKPLAA